MVLDRFVVDALRVTLLLGLALAAMPLLGRSPSATRRFVLALALGGALVLPIVSEVAPAWRLEAPAAVVALRGVVVSEPIAAGSAAAQAASPREEHSPREARVEAPARIGIGAWLAFAWGLGALVVLARLGVGLVRARAIVRRAAPASAWSIAIARAERAIGLRAEVRVTSELDAPAVTGVLSPVVLVPRASEEWSGERQVAVLLHELAHVRQRDCLVQIIAQIACAVHWFNPLAWLALRRLRIERELAADDVVITAGARPSTYAEDLIAIAQIVGAARSAPAGALGMAERSELAARVVAIVSSDRARRPLTRLGASLLVGGTASVVLAVACATPAATKPEVSAAPPVAKLAPPRVGSTIDPKIQAIADQELDRAMGEWQAAAGTVLVLDPATGAILANAGRAHGAPADVAVKSEYITGSTLKAITLTAALEEEVIAKDESFDCGNGAWTYQGKVMHDANPHGTLTVPQMLAVSTNIGFTKVFDRLGGEKLGRWLRAFHFGAAPAIDGAAAGAIPARIEDKSYDGAVIAIGAKVTASPLQVAAAYAALANGGDYVAPTTSRRTGDAPRERIMKAETARTVVAMLERVVSDEEATGKLARVAGVRVAGKTGTAGWELPNGEEAVYASFVGFFPSAAARVVILVGLEQPRKGGTGVSAAAPVFARVASRILGS